MFLDGRSDRIQTPERSEYIFSNLYEFYYILKIHKKSMLYRYPASQLMTELYIEFGYPN